MDKILDQAEIGPAHLRIPQIAEIVLQAILDGDRLFRRYDLHAYVVMSNHVHMLATSLVPLATWVGPLKGYTGYAASKMMDLKNIPFWQDESYDHLVRNDTEAARITRYIEQNPVKAGLCATPQDFPWSSATPGGSRAAGQKP